MCHVLAGTLLDSSCIICAREPILLPSRPCHASAQGSHVTVLQAIAELGEGRQAGMLPIIVIPLCATSRVDRPSQAYIHDGPPDISAWLYGATSLSEARSESVRRLYHLVRGVGLVEDPRHPTIYSYPMGVVLLPHFFSTESLVVLKPA